MKRTGFAVIGSLLCLAAGTARAADHKFYLGLDVGQANFDPTEIFDNQVQSRDDHSTSFTLKVGYRFSRHLQGKLQYSYSQQHGPLQQGEQLFAAQLTVKF